MSALRPGVVARCGDGIERADDAVRPLCLRVSDCGQAGSRSTSRRLNEVK